MFQTSFEDEPFHRSRRMFCIKDKELILAPGNDPRSHFDWFLDEGWLNEDMVRFIQSTVRGFFDPTNNSIYFYFGYNYCFNNQTVTLVRDYIAELIVAFSLNSQTIINFGPKDPCIFGQYYSQLSMGYLLNFLTLSPEI